MRLRFSLAGARLESGGSARRTVAPKSLSSLYPPAAGVVCSRNFDFSGALALKHKLANAAREGARVAAADPANDLSNTSTVPVSVSDAYQVVDNYLLSENLTIAACRERAPPSRFDLDLTHSNRLSKRTGLVLTINRGCVTLQA